MKKLLTTILAVLILFSFAGCEGYINWDNAETITEKANSTTVRLNLLEEYTTGENIADSVKVKSTIINSLGLPLNTTSDDLEILTDEEGAYVNYDFKYFGKFQVEVSYLKEESEIGSDHFEYKLTADEYNIALLSATVPVTYFSLFMADSDNACAQELELNIDSTIPTIIGLSRTSSYDWNHTLPNFVQCPFTNPDFYSDKYMKSDFVKMADAFKEYINYLNELNENSKYHLFVNDFDTYYILYLFLGNGISLDQIDVFAISDGTGTQAIFREAYGTGEQPDNSISFYTEVENVWNSAKEKALNGLSYIDILRQFTEYIPWIYRYMQDFMPVLINDPELNITWIMNRNRPDAFGTSQVYTEKVQNNKNIREVNMNNILAALTEAEIKAFQDMYKFDASVFEKADENNKGIMIFLGTSTAYEEHFKEYLSFMSHYYGDDYVCYYKAHPGYAADFDDEKAALLDEFGVISLDASIPAELFYFFRNDVVMCGYTSSTFTNAEGVEISCIVNAEETYEGRADLTITTNEDGTFTVSNIKDYPGTYIWNPDTPDIFPWLQ